MEMDHSSHILYIIHTQCTNTPYYLLTVRYLYAPTKFSACSLTILYMSLYLPTMVKKNSHHCSFTDLLKRR
ncbi:hypothetical protein EON63_02405 [archaeon]|nr:MAG: hypothetical protein EON63_02405 [archaeon]